MKDLIVAIRKELDYHKFLTPINFNEENEKFVNLYNQNIEYNPQYKYNVFDSSKALSLLSELKKKSIHITNESERYLFDAYVNNLEKEIELYSKVGTPDFSKIGEIIFGVPNKKYKKLALDVLNTNSNDPVQKKELSAHEISNILEKRLNEYGFEWDIEILNNMSTKISVDPETKYIAINAKKTFSNEDAIRLMVHEIDTHVLRSENGALRSLFLFISGTANSMIHEEGLAIYNEVINNVLDEQTFKMYAARYYSCLNIDQSFFKLYDSLIKLNIPSETAMYVVARIKRGICDTSKSGGFVKDYVYFQGLYEVKNAIDTNDTLYKKMYYGSISLNDIEYIENDIQTALDNNQIILPKSI